MTTIDNDACRPVAVDVYLSGIPCVIEGLQQGAERRWCRIRSRRTGAELPAELLGFDDWLEVALRAEAEYRHAPSMMA